MNKEFFNILLTKPHEYDTKWINRVSTVDTEGEMFTIDKTSHIPVYEQLISRVERLIERGVLRAGEELPSVRALAGRLQ